MHVDTLGAVVRRDDRGAGEQCAQVRRADRLARLAFLAAGREASSAADWPAIFDALAITGHFLARDVLVDRRAGTLAGRERLVDG